MKHFLLILVLVLFSLSCGTGGSTNNDLTGGSEAGNPPDIRNVIGEVPQSSEASLRIAHQEAFSCQADEVTAINPDGNSFFADIESDCSFLLSLPIGDSYSLSFYLDESLVAEMVFDDNNDSTSPFLMIVSSGEEDINLGEIIFEGDIAYPEFEPSTQNDQDGDGLVDFDDEDDDGDGVADEGEEEIEEEEEEEEESTPPDADSDGIEDSSDNCPTTSNSSQADNDGDGDGDECDADDDGDGILDDGDSSGVVGDGNCTAYATSECDDNCQFVSNPSQEDYDYDGIGNACE